MKKIYASILVTNYNKENFLKKCLKSCVNQNFYNKEILIFDDCSSDNSISIIKKFKNIKIFLNKKKKYNSGPLNQIYGIKKLVRETRGDLIFFLDADDSFKINKLSQICKVFKNDKKLNFLQDTPLNSLTNTKMIFSKRKSQFTIWPRFYPTSSMVVRKTFFKKFLKLIQPNKFPNLEIDARFSIYTYLKKEFKIINKCYTRYNFDPKGITSNYKKYNKSWWVKRLEAFNYMQYISKKLKVNFKKGPDYYLTKLINFFIFT
tara:strand:+ start:150 stop:932 length:783 start_codon:yes stop_codon:yes gene_type:complete